MGIVNITPDSFYDGNRYTDLSDLLRDTEEKIKQGAAIIDLGAASSRSGSSAISEEEEWKRLELPLKEIRKNFPDVFISIDTYRSEIASRAAKQGADIINDISGGKMDDKMFDTIAKLDLPYILMHMQGTPTTMQQHPHYTHVVKEVTDYFLEAIDTLKKKNFHKIILDPGFGFGKDLSHNYELLAGLSKFTEMGYPVLAGLSRKSMINNVIGTNPVSALNGTTVLNSIALLNGAKILRVHDVIEAKQAIELVSYYKNH